MTDYARRVALLDQARTAAAHAISLIENGDPGPAVACLEAALQHAAEADLIAVNRDERDQHALAWWKQQIAFITAPFA